jgi:hypothetical protein
MGRPGTAPRGAAAQPRPRGSTRRDSGDGRLDPVRWRRPGRGTLLRLVAVAVLLATAAVVSWSPPSECTQPAGAAADPPSASPWAAAPPSAGMASPGQNSGTAPPVVPRGSVGVPVRLADPTALSLVRPGNRVDLLRVDARRQSTAVAAAALVLNVTGAGDPTSGGLLLALTPAEARQAVTGLGDGFAIVIRPG